jgi:hypothetical protein
VVGATQSAFDGQRDVYVARRNAWRQHADV